MARLRDNISLVEQIERARESGKIKLNKKELGVIYALKNEGQVVSIEEILTLFGESIDKYTKNALAATISRANVELKKISIEIVCRYKMGYLLRRKKTEEERKKLTKEQIAKHRESNRIKRAKEREKARMEMANPSEEYLEQMKKLIDRTRGEKKW